jgi:hypothetical protein
MRGPVREVDARTLEVVRTLDAPRLSSNSHAFITADDLLVVAGDEGQAAFDRRTGARRWALEVRTGSSPKPCAYCELLTGERHWAVGPRTEFSPRPCPFFLVTEDQGRTYCGNYFGQIEERDLATGERTGVRFDAQLGSVGDLVSATENELTAFAASEGAYSGWRLDGSGLIGRMLAPGAASPVGYDPSGRFLVQTGTGVVSSEGKVQKSHGVVLDSSSGEPVVDVPVAAGFAWVAAGTLAYWGAEGAGLLDVVSGRTRSSSALGTDTDQAFREPAGGQAWASEPQEDGTTLLRRFDPNSDGPVGTELRVPGAVQSVAFPPDGRVVLVTYLQDDWHTARYDVASGRLLGTGMPGQARIAVSSTGWLVGADQAGEVTAFDLESLTPVASLPGSRAGPSSLQFDSSGSRLLVTSGDQTVQVYDAATQIRLGDALPAGSPEGLVEGWIRPDGRAVAVNGPLGIVEWAIDPEGMARAACVMAGRNLTRTEWSTYLGDTEPYRPTCPGYPEGV